jgi:hypothetical protein
MDGGVTASYFFGETCHQMIASYPRREHRSPAST